MNSNSSMGGGSGGGVSTFDKRRGYKNYDTDEFKSPLIQSKLANANNTTNLHKTSSYSLSSSNKPTNVSNSPKVRPMMRPNVHNASGNHHKKREKSIGQLHGNGAAHSTGGGPSLTQGLTRGRMTDFEGNTVTYQGNNPNNPNNSSKNNNGLELPAYMRLPPYNSGQCLYHGY